MNKAAIGVDIGGGSVKLGVLTPGGRVLFRSQFLTLRQEGRAKLLDELDRHVRHLSRLAKDKQFRIVGIGIGAPGPIDVEKGFIHFFPNIPGWKNTPLKTILQKKMGLPVYVDNDANVMALAEFCYGAGRGVRTMIGLTLGTGVGGGIVLCGKLFHGSRFSAAEIGHLVVDENGPLCACGNRGCIETYVGTDHFTREVRSRLKKAPRSVLKKWMGEQGLKLTPALVARAAKRGDKLSQRMWLDTAEHLGTALAGLVNILNPEKIILGGGIAQSGDLLFKPVRKAIHKKAFPIAARSVRVVRAQLGVDAGWIGAAAMVFQKW